jgi:hypothetical protein
MERGAKEPLAHRNLLITYPALVNEWHPTKNTDLNPQGVATNSHKKAWWICSKGHEWEASIASRTGGRGCPYCSGKATSEDNCLQTVDPALAREWHPTRTGRLTDKDVRPFSNKKAWWICARNHEWQAVIASRSRGSGCPFCRSATSALELRILCEIKYLFGDVQHRRILYGEECDIFIPGLRMGIELDGLYWHKNRSRQDKVKNAALKGKGIALIRLREEGLERTSATDIFFTPRESDLVVVGRLVRKLLEEARLNGSARAWISAYLRANRLANDSEYKRLLDMLPSPLPGFSLQDQNPDLAEEWHSERNGSLTARNVSSSSNKKVWWICSRGHEWEATVNHRTSGRGCPYCAGKAACEDNCLQTLNPALAKEWHPSRNGTLTARDVTAQSNKKVWWVCSKGHEWQAAVYSRSNGKGCPYCTGRTACVDNCLQTLNPVLAKEWHLSRNGTLTARDVTAQSNKKVWWICSKGHEWQAVVASRNQGFGCPYCVGQAVCDENCLQTLSPALAEQWHPTKNGSLTPRDCTLHSGKKVWWRCSKGHEWQAIVAGRSAGKGCPYCAGKRR